MQKSINQKTHRLWSMDYGLWTNKGFSLLEIMIVIMILGFLVAMVAVRFGGISGEAAVVTTLREMESIREAINRFYLDLGLIPEDATNPQWATRFLCLKDDGGAGNPEYDEMRIFVGSDDLMTWDRFSRRGWRGPYLEREIMAYDAGAWHPLIIDPWGKSVDHSVDPDRVTGEYRILGGQDKAAARIVSLGANGRDDGGETATVAQLNDPNHDIGDDLVMFIFGGGPVRRP